MRGRRQPHMYTILVFVQSHLNMKHLLLCLRALDMVQAVDFACHRTLSMISDHLDRTFRGGMIAWVAAEASYLTARGLNMINTKPMDG